MVSRAEAIKMPRKKVEKALVESGAHPGSALWDELEPVIRLKTEQAEARRFWIGVVSTALIGVAAVVVAILK